jgi:hypothetical protein
MRTWVKATLGGLVLIAVVLGVVAGTGAYFVFRNMEKRAGTELEAVQAIDVVKARFGSRAPLVEIVDLQRGDIRINHSVDASAARVDTIHVINWKKDTGELARTEVPLWLMRFSTVNILSKLGIAPAQFRLTVNDIERYGPGIVVEYGSPGTFRILLWVD